MKKLVVEEFTFDGTQRELEIGEQYSYFKDPETGKYYRPIEGYTVTANEDGDLNDRFIEVLP